MGRKHVKIAEILHIFLGGPMGPIHPVWGNGCNISSAIRRDSCACEQEPSALYAVDRLADVNCASELSP